MRKLVFCIIPLGLAVVFILLCLQGCPNLYDRTVVAGIITDVDGTPLQGAKIYCHYTRYKGWIGIHPTVSGDLEGYTNEEGRFELDAYRAVTGRLTFSNSGYKSQKLTFTRHKGEPEKAELKVRLNKYGKDNVTIFSDKEISSEPINQGYASLSFQGDFPESTLLFRPNKNENSDSIIFFTFDESKEERICRLKSG